MRHGESARRASSPAHDTPPARARRGGDAWFGSEAANGRGSNAPAPGGGEDADDRSVAITTDCTEWHGHGQRSRPQQHRPRPPCAGGASALAQILSVLPEPLPDLNQTVHIFVSRSLDTTLLTLLDKHHHGLDIKNRGTEFYLNHSLSRPTNVLSSLISVEMGAAGIRIQHPVLLAASRTDGPGFANRHGERSFQPLCPFAVK